MNKKRKAIEPQYLYNQKGKPTHVYLSIDDYQAFMTKLKKLSKEAQALVLKKKKQVKK